MQLEAAPTPTRRDCERPGLSQQQAHALPARGVAASFDIVVSAYTLCSIPDAPRQGVRNLTTQQSETIIYRPVESGSGQDQVLALARFL